MNTAIGISIIVLLVVLSLCAIALTVFAVKWLIEFTLLTKNINDTTTIVKKELEPMLGELNETIVIVNNLAKNIDGQVSTLKKIVSTVVGFASVFAGKFKFLQSSFFKGFMSSFNLFRKK